MRSELGDRIRLQHIFDAIKEIEKYLIAEEFPVFIENSMMRFACSKQMQIKAEPGNQLSVE